jgi:hypothetical protein
MPLTQVQPIIDISVRALCARPYALHPKGCPNIGKSDRCPPVAPEFTDVFDLHAPVYAVINEFDLIGHVERMREKHPAWSGLQVACVLYWQGTARKQLRAKIDEALAILPGYAATWCPEAMGVNVTATLEQVGIALEWPPVHIVRQVALLAVPRKEV